MSTITPRPYQIAAHDAVFSEWKDKRSTLLEMATGTGKTIVFAMILRTLAGQGKRGLVLAHRDELIRQAVDKLKMAVDLECAVEKADERGDGGEGGGVGGEGGGVGGGGAWNRYF